MTESATGPKHVQHAKPSGFHALLPVENFSMELKGVDTEGSYAVHPEELALVENSVQWKINEFKRGRFCAHTALAKVGVAEMPLLRRSDGSPDWPLGVVGSITHCAGYSAAVVATSDSLASLGIDAEPNQPLPEGLLRMVATPEEQQQLARLEMEEPDIQWDRLLFSAKESVFKARFSSAATWLEFEDITVTFHAGKNDFTASIRNKIDILRSIHPRQAAGRWSEQDGILLTVAWHLARVPS